MKIQSILKASLILALFAGVSCGSDDDDDDSNPSAPSLGDQIDRAGRAAISTALIGAFNGSDDDATSLKNAYNQASAGDSDDTSEIAGNLAIYDAIDGNCTNQAFSDGDTDEGNYDTLAGVLTDDYLYINAANTTCAQYLGAELGTDGDCGGRAPSYDVIEVTYSALVTGSTSGTDDAAPAEDGEHSDTTFPFLAAP